MCVCAREKKCVSMYEQEEERLCVCVCICAKERKSVSMYEQEEER